MTTTTSTTSTVSVVGDAESIDEQDATATSALLDLARRPRFFVPAIVLLLVFAMAAVPKLFTRTDPRFCPLERSRLGPASGHPFGFDVQGCDYLANVIYGARPSVLVSLSVSVAGFVLASVMGLLAGYFPGFVDGTISRLADVLFALPGLVAIIVILQSFANPSIWAIALVIVSLGWPGGMRLMRSTVLTVRNREYVLAARALGARPSHILRRHLFPNSVAPLIALTTLGVGGAVGTEATLTFLGVGLHPPAISWGLQLATGAAYRDTLHLLMWPSMFLTATVLSFVLIGDSVRDALDPKLRK
jgi:oligopeptide transport system permease protein